MVLLVLVDPCAARCALMDPLEVRCTASRMVSVILQVALISVIFDPLTTFVSGQSITNMSMMRFHIRLVALPLSMLARRAASHLHQVGFFVDVFIVV